MTPLSLQDRQEIHDLTKKLMAAAIAALETEEGIEPQDLDEILAEPALPEHWPLIQEAFQGFRVPFDPDVRAFYETTLGIQNPFSDMPAVCLPFLSAGPADGGVCWSTCDLEGNMDSNHLWPLENMLDGDADAFPCVMLAQVGTSGLAICETGKWSALAFDGEGGREPRREDFTLTFLEALRIFVDKAIVNWAAAIADDQRGGYAYQSVQLCSTSLPAPVRVNHDALTAPRDLSPYGRVSIQVYAPSWIAAAAPGAMPGDSGYEAPEAAAPEVADIFPVVGLPFADFAEVQDEITDGSMLELKPVDDNPHDLNAVEVWFEAAGGKAFRIGFLARQDAPSVRAQIADGSASSTAQVIDFTARFVGDAMSGGILLRLRSPKS